MPAWSLVSWHAAVEFVEKILQEYEFVIRFRRFGRIRGRMNAELAGYLHPKWKAVELNGAVQHSLEIKIAPAGRACAA